MELKAEGIPVGGYVALVVEDIDAARDALIAKGIDVIDVQMLRPNLKPGSRFLFLFYKDRNGNGWTVKEAKRW
jgi:hypothetical protein